jgi:hypothetical protein
MTRLHFVRKVLLNPGTLGWIVESDAHDIPPAATSEDPSNLRSLSCGGHVVGWAIWTRHGISPAARNWQHANEAISTQFERLLHSIGTQYLIPATRS